MKWCSGCMQHRPVLDFNRNRSRSDGLDTRCRPCSRARMRDWHKSNPERQRALNAARQSARRAAARKRVPWYDSQAVQKVYAEAEARRRAGEDVQVDHVVPLRSRLVCGLHVQTNLVIALRGPNLAKGNRHWPDMPDFCNDSAAVIGSRAIAECAPTSQGHPHQ